MNLKQHIGKLEAEMLDKKNKIKVKRDKKQSQNILNQKNCREKQFEKRYCLLLCLLIHKR